MSAQPHIIPEDADGQRLDRWLKQYYSHAKFSDIQKWCRTGQIRVDGKRVKGNEKMNAGQLLRVPPFIAATGAEDNFLPLTENERNNLRTWIIHEDAELVVINKPAGIASQAGGKNVRSADRLLSALFQQPIRLTHRLDKVTSGVLVCAKNRATAESMADQFKKRTLQKTYVAIAQGSFMRPTGQHLPPEGVIDEPLLRQGSRSTVDDAGKNAVTYYKVEDALADGAFRIILQPKTGRMHQLRAHMAFMGAPLVGDEAYGWEEHWPQELADLAPNIALHAYTLEIAHPKTGQDLTLTAPLPTWAKLGQD